MYQSKRPHIAVAQATCSQILAYQISVFPVIVHQLPKYVGARGLAYCLCKAIFLKVLYTPKFPLTELFITLLAFHTVGLFLHF